MQKTRLLAPALAGLALTGMVGLTAAPALAAAPTAPAATSAARTGTATATSTLTSTLADGSTFAGTFTPTGFTTSNGQLSVTGLVTGAVTSTTGVVTQIVPQTVTTAVTGATTTGTCQILSLQLGPLHLDLLGLVVDLNQVNLNITAQSGPGNLLGNLLCAVANLLNGGNLGGLATLLNSLLGL